MWLVGNKVRGDDGDDTVPEPVGCGGNTNTTGTDGEREDLANDDPGGRAPSHRERGNVQADEGDHSLNSGGVVAGSLASCGSNDTNDELHDDHGGGTEDKKLTATELLNDVERDGSRQDVDKGGDEGDQEGVADRAELLEENGTEVEDEVDTGQLLHHLHEYTKNGTAEVGRWLADRSREARCPRSKIAGLGDNGHFVLVVGNDLSEFVLDVFRIDRAATD